MDYGFWNIVAKAACLVNSFIVISALTLYEYGVFQLMLAIYASMSTIWIGCLCGRFYVTSR